MQVTAARKEQFDDDQFVWFLVPVGLRVVAIQHEKTKLYISMNSDSRIFASVNLAFLILYRENNRISGALHKGLQIQRERL